MNVCEWITETAWKWDRKREWEHESERDAIGLKDGWKTSCASEHSILTANRTIFHI